MGANVLFIDDEKDITELARVLLDFNDFAAVTANDGKEALKILEEQKFDAIATDIMMPEISGFDLIEQVRTSGKDYANVPIIVLTAKILTPEERKLLMHHNVMFLSKPFEPSQLVDLLNDAIRQNK